LRSDAQGHAAGTAGADAFITAATRFLLAADAAQVKLAPEKCAALRALLFRPSACRAARSRAPDPCLTRRARAPVAALCRRLREACVARGCAGRGLAALAAAARKAAPTQSHLTSQHVDLLQLSLLALNYAAALPLLETDIFEVVPSATGLVPKDFLLFCFYGASLLCAVKRFARAAELLTQALAAPAMALNAIQLACYKKLVRQTG
jgi:hypothetical protein